ncbi:MAG: RidA/YER057c/UK114 superfamily, group 6, partial [uncultured Gemmatimonadetes bacterium]
ERAPSDLQQLAVGAGGRLLAGGTGGPSRARRRHHRHRRDRPHSRPRRPLRAGRADAPQHPARPGAGRRAPGRRGAHPHVRHRHRALGRGRPRPRRVLLRHPPRLHPGGGARPHRPRHAGGDRSGGVRGV